MTASDSVMMVWCESYYGSDPDESNWISVQMNLEFQEFDFDRHLNALIGSADQVPLGAGLIHY